MLLRLFGLMTLTIILSPVINILARELNSGDFMQNKTNKQTKTPNSDVSLHSDMYRLTFFFKLGMVMNTANVHSLIPALMPLICIEGYSCMRKQKLMCLFSHKEKRFE